MAGEIRATPLRLRLDFGHRSAADARHEQLLHSNGQSPVTSSARGAIGSSEERNKWAGARPATAGREGGPFMPDPTLNRSRPVLGGRPAPLRRPAPSWGLLMEWCFVFQTSQELVLWSPGGATFAVRNASDLFSVLGLSFYRSAKCSADPIISANEQEWGDSNRRFHLRGRLFLPRPFLKRVPLSAKASVQSRLLSFSRFSEFFFGAGTSPALGRRGPTPLSLRPKRPNPAFAPWSVQCLSAINRSPSDVPPSPPSVSWLVWSAPGL